MPRDPIPNSPAPDMMAAMLHDLADTQQRQRQCGQALRALAALTDAADSSAPPPTLRRGDLAALFAVIADSALLLATEAEDTLRSRRPAP